VNRICWRHCGKELRLTFGLQESYIYEYFGVSFPRVHFQLAHAEKQFPIVTVFQDG
jgi:hypothetical protein